MSCESQYCSEMKLLILIALVGFLAALAQAETCVQCLTSSCLPCLEECIDPEDPLCWACLLADCTQCIGPCFVSIIDLPLILPAVD